ncbi:MAG: hypothetical protein NTZ16_09530 [Verrucomicrobia bacterium]|nr:hypothetical protein [Verrucomicrobiota bacterium]
MNSDQWRYDKAFSEICPVSDAKHPMAHGHTADKQAMAVRCGWLPCYPQFTARRPTRKSWRTRSRN